MRPSTFKATVPIPALLPGAEVFIITSADFLGVWAQGVEWVGTLL